MVTKDGSTKKSYVPPSLTELGSLHDLTQVEVPCTNKLSGASDGLTFLNQPIRCS